VLRRPIESGQYTSYAFSDRLADAVIAASIGRRGDSYDNAMAEALNGNYKHELVKLHGPWRTRSHLEVATIEWIDWYNQRRRHREIGLLPPAEVEAAWNRDNGADPHVAPRTIAATDGASRAARSLKTELSGIIDLDDTTRTASQSTRVHNAHHAIQETRTV
jgi:putative transposase